MLKFFDWAYKNGGKMAEELDYVPMPASVVKQIEAVWKKDQGRLRQANLLIGSHHTSGKRAPGAFPRPLREISGLRGRADTA